MTNMEDNPKGLVAKLRDSFDSGKTRPINYRIKQLTALHRMYVEKKNEITQALYTDLHKPKQESICLEIDMLLNDLIHLLNNIHAWAKPEKVPKEFANLLDKAQIYKDPYGVVLVMGAWNYPLQLTMMPVAGAIAAGNCVIIKPSEVSSATEKFLVENIPKYLDQDCYQVFQGGPVETTELLKEKFDYIFYTGSTVVGKIVHAAAAKHLTPVTLELGGKSPVYLDDSANIDVAAHRILWGKLVNCGQTCVAPDYLLCSKEVSEKFVDVFKKIVKEFYGENPKTSKDYCRIINDRHFQRIAGLLKSGKIAAGGEIDEKERYIAPTLLTDVSASDPIMSEEIFGPILPIVYIKDADEAVNFIKSREKPLALYIFSNKKVDVELFLTNTSAGGVSVNDTIMHLVVDTLPFGGVGSSGMGSYHGRYSFDTFTHKKSVLYKDLGMLGEKLGVARYPPYSDGKIAYLEMMLGKQSFINILMRKLPHVLIFALGLGTAFAWSYYIRGNAL